MKEITDKMNAIELQTRELLEKAQFLEEQKNMMSHLMDCSVNDHEWLLRHVTSTLTKIHQLDLHCVRCGSTANFLAQQYPRGPSKVVESRPIPIFSAHEQRLSTIVGEEE